MSNLNSEDLDRLLKKERKDVYNEVLTTIAKVSNKYYDKEDTVRCDAVNEAWSAVAMQKRKEYGTESEWIRTFVKEKDNGENG